MRAAVGILGALYLLPVACGGKTGGGGGAPPAAEPTAPSSISPPYELPRMAPPIDTNSNAPATVGAPGTTMTDGTPGRCSSSDDLARAVVQDILDKACGGCHGQQATINHTAQGGLDDIDIDCLVEAGFIVPLQSSASPIVRRMLDQSMPPAGVEPRPTDADIQIVIDYIDNPRFWPDIWDSVDAGTPDLADAAPPPDPGSPPDAG